MQGIVVEEVERVPLDVSRREPVAAVGRASVGREEEEAGP
jgi:hypothetical protein